MLLCGIPQGKGSVHNTQSHSRMKSHGGPTNLQPHNIEYVSSSDGISGKNRLTKESIISKLYTTPHKRMLL